MLIDISLDIYDFKLYLLVCYQFYFMLNIAYYELVVISNNSL